MLKYLFILLLFILSCAHQPNNFRNEIGITDKLLKSDITSDTKINFQGLNMKISKEFSLDTNNFNKIYELVNLLDNRIEYFYRSVSYNFELENEVNNCKECYSVKIPLTLNKKSLKKKELSNLEVFEYFEFIYIKDGSELTLIDVEYKYLE